MTCQELIDFIMDYTDGKLDEAARTELDKHLSACAACRAYLEAYRRTVELARQAREAVPSPSMLMPPALIESIRKAARSELSRTT